MLSGMLRNSDWAKSKIINLVSQFELTLANTFIVSNAWSDPIIPVVAPSTPRVLHVARFESSNPGNAHSRHGVVGGLKTATFPSKPIAPPNTNGIWCSTEYRFSKYRVR